MCARTRSRRAEARSDRQGRRSARRARLRVASRLDLLREVWGYAEDVMSRTVDTHVAMLRRKLEDDPAHPRHIVTVRTFGYRIEL